MAQNLQIVASQTNDASVLGKEQEFVTVQLADQMFGIPVLRVQDVLRGLKVTKVPLAPKEIAGSLNLRGRIVTAINLRECLGLPSVDHHLEKSNQVMSVVVEYKDEFFSLIVDTVGDVVKLSSSQLEKSPANLSGRWKDVALGIYKLDQQLLVILDVQKLLKF